MVKKKPVYFTRMLKTCRQEWSRHNPERKQCFLRARIKNGTIEKWKCAECNNLFAKSEIDCDHIIPIGNTIPQNFTEFMLSFEKLHCPTEFLQILCKTCHKIKTKLDYRSEERSDMISVINSYFNDIGYLFDSIESLNFSDVQKLYKIIAEINIEENQDKLWKLKKKLLKFLEKHG